MTVNSSHFNLSERNQAVVHMGERLVGGLSQLFSSLFIQAATDVMLLDNFSTDGSSHLHNHHHHGPLSGKRRSSVTFEDQVEHSKGMFCPSTTSRAQQRNTDKS